MKFASALPGWSPDLRHAGYASTALRGPTRAPLPMRAPFATNHGVQVRPGILLPKDADLTAHGNSAPLGERIIVTGTVKDEDGRPVCNSLIEVWQCNAAGRYVHPQADQRAPLDPNFMGYGKLLTDHAGHYRFVTIKPSAYPWGNHTNAWRPAHIHFSLFGNVHAQRLITQMYFPGDPLFKFDPILHSIADETARQTLVSRFSLEDSVSGVALGYRFDIVLGGRGATPMGL